MAARERVEFDVVGRDVGGSKAFKDVGDAADKAGDKIKDSGDKAVKAAVEYAGLAHEINQVEGNVRRLAAEINRTGNKDLFKDLNKQRSELRKLNQIKTLLPEVDTAGIAKQGSAAGAAFSGGFRGFLTSPQGLAIGAVVAAALVPTLSAAVAGAVVGGVGVGGVVGGIMLASKDARVQAAGKQLGETVMADLNESGARFVEPALKGIGIIRGAWQDVSGDVDSALAASARYVEPLAEGVANFVRELMPGIRDAAEAAGPIVREISDGLPRLGAALSDMLSGFADHADEGASAIRYLFMVVETGIDAVGGLVDAFASVYSTLLDVGDVAGTIQEALFGWIPFIGDHVKEGHDKIKELKAALDGAGQSGSDAGDKIGGGLQKVRDKATDSIGALQAWRDELDKMTGTNLSARQAQRDLEAAIDDASAAVKENGKTAIDHGAALDINTAKGRANAAALDKIAKGANDAYDAVLEQTGSQDLANAAAERGRAKFIELARKMGLSKDAANTLAGQLLKIKDRKVTVSANTQPALTAAENLVARINNMRARVGVGVYGSGAYGGGAHTGQGHSTGYSTGGYVDGPGPKGVDSRPAMLAVGEGVLTAREIDRIGGRAGFEQLRMTLRSGQPAPAGASAGSNQSTTAGPGFGDLLAEFRALRQLVASMPMVRLDSGLRADIYSRGG